jgi:hypothetical protein
VTDNPYQSPGVVAEEEPPSELRQQLEVGTMEWFLRANDGVVFMLFALGLTMASSGAYVFFGEEETTAWLPLGYLLVGMLVTALAWFQWGHHLLAIAISGVLSLAMLILVSILIVSFAGQHIVGRPSPLTRLALVGELVALLIGFVFIAAWIYAVSLPLQVALRAWTWHRQGIDVREIRAEIRRRA